MKGREKSRDDLQSHRMGTSLLEYVIVLGSESAARPPCCSSDKKLNIWVLSKLILNFTAFEILPISPFPHMHVLPVWKLILLYALAMTGCESTLWNDAVPPETHGNFWVQVSMF